MGDRTTLVLGEAVVAEGHEALGRHGVMARARWAREVAGLALASEGGQQAHGHARARVLLVARPPTEAHEPVAASGTA